ncbi:MAG: NAD(P)/FAD-dependent oxidoreductase [Dehalogenimonas sp.]
MNNSKSTRRAPGTCLKHNSKRIVVIGAGFAGLAAIKELNQIDVPVEITLIDRQNYHMFMPLLYHLTSGGISVGNICFPIRQLLEPDKCNPSITFSKSEVKQIDLYNKIVSTDRAHYGYDYLILALGSVSNYFNVPGADSNTLPLKSIRDAINIHNRVIEQFEEAVFEKDEVKRREMLTFTIVGGGPTGVELCATMAQLLFKTLKREFPQLIPLARLVLVEGSVGLLRGFKPKLGQLALRRLQKLGAELFLNFQVAEVFDSGIKAADGRAISTKNIIWVAGVKPNLMIQTLPVEKAKDGRVIVKSNSEIQDFPGVFVIGDCAHLLQKGSEKPYPPTAQGAIVTGACCGDNLARIISGKTARERQYRFASVLIFVGRNYAVGELTGKIVSGYFAFILYQINHLLKLTGFKNKLGTALDWLYDYVSSRNTSKY